MLRARDNQLPNYIRDGIYELGGGNHVSKDALRVYINERTEQELGQRIRISDYKLDSELDRMGRIGQIEMGFRLNPDKVEE